MTNTHFMTEDDRMDLEPSSHNISRAPPSLAMEVVAEMKI